MIITSYRRIIEIMNHPDVKPFFALKNGIPFNDKTYYLKAGSGAILFIDKGEYFEVHGAMLRKDKNKKDIVQKCLNWMKENHNLKKYVAFVFKKNRKSRFMCAHLGMVNTRENETHIRYEGVI